MDKTQDKVVTTCRFSITMKANGTVTRTPCYCDNCYLGPGVRSYWHSNGGRQ